VQDAGVGIVSNIVYCRMQDAGVGIVSNIVYCRVQDAGEALYLILYIVGCRMQE
jgi:hypothetical protein